MNTQDKYPEYKRGEIDALYDKLSESDRSILDDFLLSCRTTANDRKVSDIKRSILQFHNIIGKPLDKIELNDLRHYLVLLNQSKREAWGKHDLKVHIKRFIKHQYMDWSQRFNNLKELKIESVALNEKKINDKTLLKKEEIEKIMNKENDLFLKTFFITLYESGSRPSEIRKLRWEDIKFNVDGDLSEVSLFMTKNKKHKVVFVNKATFYLKKLQQESKSEYIFYSQMNNKEPIGSSTATRWINLLERHIGRHIYPYIVRHSRSDELYRLVDKNELSENVAQKTLGHKKSMRDIYSQLRKDTIQEAITKSVYKIQEVPEDKRGEFERIKRLVDVLINVNLEQIKQAKQLSDEELDALSEKLPFLNRIKEIKKREANEEITLNITGVKNNKRSLKATQ